MYPYCKNCHNAKSRKWYLAHPEKHNEVCLATQLKAKQRAVALLGGNCKRCGIDDIRVLTFDHVRGDGYLDRRNGPSAYQVIRNPDRFQLLCGNCHMIKTLEHREVLPRDDAARGLKRSVQTIGENT